MALPPMNISDESFIREVDEELQRDKALDFWKRWGLKLLAGAAALILGWGGWLYWIHRNDEARGLEAEKLAELVDNPTAPGVKALTDVLDASDSSGTRAASLMTQAAIALSKKDSKGAVALYAKVAADKDVSQPWRDLATIRQTAIEFDTLKPDEIVTRLKPLAVSGNPWFGSAGELTALAYARMGKGADAAKMFEAISKDEKVPETLRGRAKAMSTSIEVAMAPTAPEESKK